MEQTQTDPHDQLPNAPGDVATRQSESPTLSRRITGWTSNLLATAAVIMIALVVGTQLASSYRPDGDSDLLEFGDLANAWPALESCALEFGNSPVQLNRQSIHCDRQQAVATLQNKCREALEQNAMPLDESSQKESALVANIINSTVAPPVEEKKGHWRIYHVETTDSNQQLPLVVGVRDNLGTTADDGSDSRMVVWGLAMPANSKLELATTATNGNESNPPTNQADSKSIKQWTTFVARRVPDEAANRLKHKMIPTSAKRTMSIADGMGGSLIGFHCSQSQQAIEYYNQLATDEGWDVLRPWQQRDDAWSAQFKLPKDSQIQGIQVQLSVKHNEMVRGMLLVK